MGVGGGGGRICNTNVRFADRSAPPPTPLGPTARARVNVVFDHGKAVAHLRHAYLCPTAHAPVSEPNTIGAASVRLLAHKLPRWPR